MFLKQYASTVLDELAQGLRLVTLRVSCDYFHELCAFDTIDLGVAALAIGMLIDIGVDRPTSFRFGPDASLRK
jgi:hypothetical protein